MCATFAANLIPLSNRSKNITCRVQATKLLIMLLSSTSCYVHSFISKKILFHYLFSITHNLLSLGHTIILYFFQIVNITYLTEWKYIQLLIVNNVNTMSAIRLQQHILICKVTEEITGENTKSHSNKGCLHVACKSPHVSS